MSVVLPESELLGKSVSAAAQRHMNLIAKTWDAEVKAALAYFVVLLRRNTGTLDEDVLNPDYRARLTRAGDRARDSALPVLERAALAGSLMGFRSASQNYKDLGLSLDSKFDFSGGDLLMSLQSDLEHIAVQFPEAILSALQKEDEDSLKGAFRRYSMRTQMVVEAAVKMYAYRTLIQYMQGTPTVAEWRTTSPLPCKFCTYLDGQQRPWGTPFEVPNFPIYGKVLYGPQLHPNCRCVLLVVK
jgi:hypothetical protein